MSRPLTFDEYCLLHGIEPAGYPPAFAAYLNEIAGWDGEVVRVDTGADEFLPTIN
ncbi:MULTISPECIES: hypothetical protein [Microbacterium]|uniref:hypothetical protein n=1 Tax=Microbacterium TaxID=33882 RepID=UPI0013A5A81F|nr:MULTISPECIES: hypothetical protein [Microbacterium]